MTATVLALSGSARAGSVNRKLLAVASKALSAHGVAVNEIDVRALDLPIYDGDLEDRDGQPAGVGRLREAIAAADGLLIAAPEYNHSIPPLLKNAIDWVSHPIAQSPFRGKAAAIMSAAARPWGGTRMLPHLRDVLADLGTIVIPAAVAVPVAHAAFDGDGALGSAKTAAFLERTMAAFADELRLRARQDRSTQAPAQVELTN
jgi:chromate reductase